MKKVLLVVMISIIFIGLEKIAMGLSMVDPEDPVGEGPPITLEGSLTRNPSGSNLDVSLTSPLPGEASATVAVKWSPVTGFTLEGDYTSSPLTIGEDTTISFGPSLTFTTAGIQTSFSIALQGPGRGFSATFGPKGYSQSVSMTSPSGETQTVNIKITPDRKVEFEADGKYHILQLGQSFVTLEYSLDLSTDTPPGWSVKISSEERKKIEEGAKAIAQNLAEQFEAQESGRTGAVKGAGGEMRIPQGWFLSLSSEGQKVAIELIRRYVAMELEARGIGNIDKFRFILGIGEATDENGCPKTIVAFGLKREKVTNDSQGGTTAGSGIQGGESGIQGGESGVKEDVTGTGKPEDENPPDRKVFFVDVADGNFFANFSYERTQGLSLSLGENSGDRNWTLSLSPQGWKMNFGVNEGNLSLSTGIAQNGEASVDFGFPLGEGSQGGIRLERRSDNSVRLSFTGNNPNGTGTTIWWSSQGLLGADFWGPIGGGLGIKISMDSTGSISIGLFPQEGG
ncbi:MAG: hypothetical protein J7J54_01230 [Candidatus Omnitrophica bacterium]|nr:hypothetical protein [Candidatus Omnitrophota bacterium]